MRCNAPCIRVGDGDCPRQAMGTVPGGFGNRPAHIQRARMEYPKKFPTRDQLREELTGIKRLFPAVYDAIPDDMGVQAFGCILHTMLLCGIDTAGE